MPKPTPQSPLNLNSAQLEELTRLPGVGPALARRIVAARPFSTARDLILVDGVGPKLYASLLPLLTVEETLGAGSGSQDGEASGTPVPEPGPVSADATATGDATAVPGEPAGPIASPAAPVTAPRRPRRRVKSPPPEQPLEHSPASGELAAAPAEAWPAQGSAPETILAHPLQTDAGAAPGTLPEDGKPVSRRASLPREGTIASAQSFAHPPGPAMATPGVVSPAASQSSMSASLNRRMYTVPARTRWRIMLTLFYGIIGLAIVGLAALMYAAFSIAPEATALPGTQAASLPAAAITSVLASPTGGGVAVAAVTATETGLLAGGASTPTLQAIIPPSETPAASETPAPPTVTATNTPRPSATASVTPTPTPTQSPTASATPSKTLTPTSTFTPTPAPTSPAGAGALLFRESFDPKSYYWGVGNTGFSRSVVGDGQLTITVDRAALAYVFGDLGQGQDFYYQATVRPGACQEGDSYGLQVRAQDDLNFYLFGVTCEGRVRVQVTVGGSYTVLVNDPPHPAVNTGQGAVNVLAVRAAGRTFQFLANGQTLVALDDARLALGQFGLYARSFRSPTFAASFDDVTGWEAAP